MKMKHLAIIAPGKDRYSETFIKDAIIRLKPALFLQGCYFPKYYAKGWDAPIHPIGDQRELQAILKQHEIQAVLAEYGPTGVAIMEACREINIPFYVHFHGYDAYREDVMAYYGSAYEIMFQDAAGLIVVSRDMQQQLHKLGAPPEKTFLIPYGVDRKKFQPSEKFRSGHFLAIGRFVAKKGPELTIKAFSLISEAFPKIKLTMAGNGPLLENCKALVAELGLENRIHFLGTVSHEEVARLLNSANAIVQHSLSPRDNDSEGLPLFILEAMASGLPVISTVHAGIPDAVQHGVTGWLSPSGDVAAMASNMQEVLEDPERGRQMGKNGRDRVLKHYTHKRYIADLRTLLSGKAERAFFSPE